MTWRSTGSKRTRAAEALGDAFKTALHVTQQEMTALLIEAGLYVTYNRRPDDR